MGESVTSLDYEAFAEMALDVLTTIGHEIEERFGVKRLAIIHRTGTVAVGEASVMIAAAAPHRGAAFDAARYAIEELKARAPIWKAERFSSGSVWLGAPAREGPIREG
jgi:molybdopterin synthase catalytic subunit